jgi:hypothetical protein
MRQLTIQQNTTRLAMKRDMDLIRKMLLEIESRDDVFIPSDDPADYRRIAYHLLQLNEGGLITGIEATESVGGELLVHVATQPRLTWAGHEFLDLARNETVWADAKEKVGDSVGTVSLEIMNQLLTQIAKQRLRIGQ